MSVVRTRSPAFPVLSMLDLLCGAFGAMIVLSVLLTFLRLDQSRFDQIPFVFVGIDLKSDPNVPSLNAVYIEFVLESENGAQSAWTPRSGIAPPTVGRYHASHGERAVSATLMLDKSDLDSLGTGRRLIAQVQNLPTLEETPPAMGAALSASITIKTAHNGCAMPITIPLEELLSAETTATQLGVPTPAPSMFDLFRDFKSNGARQFNCFRNAGSQSAGLDFVVKYGSISLDYHAP